MRKFLSILLLFLVTLGLFVHDAEARRFGGGRSFGISRSTSSFSRAGNAGQNYFRQPLGQQTSSASRWLGPLAGLAAGGLLASLFMGNGMGSGILSWILVGGLFLMLFSFMRNRMQPRQNYNDDYRNAWQKSNISSFPPSAAMNTYPVGFDAPTFLREAKAQYIRLQAAYDQKNLNDIREFTTPEVFAEIQLQFQERGIEENKTDVVSLEAELLNVETEMQSVVATVKFNGMIQEDKNLPAASISEIWHFKKESGNLRWAVAGVQQE